MHPDQTKVLIHERASSLDSLTRHAAVHGNLTRSLTVVFHQPLTRIRKTAAVRYDANKQNARNPNRYDAGRKRDGVCAIMPKRTRGSSTKKSTELRHGEKA